MSIIAPRALHISTFSGGRTPNPPPPQAEVATHKYSSHDILNLRLYPPPPPFKPTMIGPKNTVLVLDRYTTNGNRPDYTKQQAKNYGPVSLTSIPCKILEQLIREGILNHLMTNNTVMARKSAGSQKSAWPERAPGGNLPYQ